MGCLNLSVEKISNGIEVSVHESGIHITPHCTLVCTVEVRWEEFITADNQPFYDNHNELYMVKI